MPRNLDQTSGRVTLRMPQDIHGEIVRVAKILGTDATGIVNEMIREMLPAYVAKAQSVVMNPEQPPGQLRWWKLGATVTRGDRLKVAADGLAVTATTDGDFVIGYAAESGAKGDIIAFLPSPPKKKGRKRQ
jgi:hypothetical protein